MFRIFSFGFPLFMLISISAYCYGLHPLSPENKKEVAGVEFYHGSYQEALKKAKQENKNIFLDIYASWCGPCKMLKRNTFPDTEVGEYFNKHFINLSIDGETSEGAELASKYRIRGYPSLFILDKNGNILTQTAGYLPPSEILRFAKSPK